MKADESVYQSGSRAERELPAGTLVDGQFEVQSLLGRGGMCAVYLARDTQFSRDVALKVLRPHLLAEGAEILKRFQREAKAASKLEHPNIVKVYRFGLWNGEPYMALEYLKGTSLAQVVQNEHRLSNERALPLFLQICDALSYAHENGVVHRDLKPANVMLTGEGDMVKLVDFGIAKILPEPGQDMQKLTQTHKLLGTLAYMSPEQAMGEPVDARSDIYSMGCLMHEVLTGQNVSDESSSLANLYARFLAPEISGSLDERMRGIITQCLEKEPSRRQHSAEELKAQLQSKTDAAATTMHAKERGALSRKWLWLPAALLVVVGMLAVFFLSGDRKESGDKKETSSAHETVNSEELFHETIRVHDRATAGHGIEQAHLFLEERRLAQRTITQQEKDHLLDLSRQCTLYRYLADSYLQARDQQYGAAADAVEKEVDLRIQYRDHPEDIANGMTVFANSSVKAHRSAEALRKIAAFRERAKPQSVQDRAGFIVAEATCYAELKDLHGFESCYNQLKNVPLPPKWRESLEKSRLKLQDNQ